MIEILKQQVCMCIDCMSMFLMHWLNSSRVSNHNLVYFINFHPRNKIITCILSSALER